MAAVRTGLMDLQVNGYLGVDFSSPDLTEADFRQAVQGLIGKGVGSFLPTIITSAASTYERNLRLMSRVIEEAELEGHIPGIHAEGPFISAAAGAVGAHNPEWVRGPDRAFFDQMQSWADGKIKVLTLAAELPGVDKLIRYAGDQEVRVFLGHQDAQLADLRRCAEAGARAITHFGNGMPNIVPRHDNILLYGLAVDDLAVTIIGDGHHLPAHLIKTIIRVKGIDRVAVVSDASPLAGMPAGSYRCLGNDVILEPSGLLHNPAKQCLVGSSATLVECTDWLEMLAFLSAEDIHKLISENPRRLLANPS